MPQRLDRRDRAVDPALLQHDPHSCPQGVVMGRESEDPDGAGVGLAQALADLDRGGLSGAVGTQHRRHSATPSGEVELVDHRPAGVALDQAPHLHGRDVLVPGIVRGEGRRHAQSLEGTPGDAVPGLLRNNGVVKILERATQEGGQDAGRQRVAASLLAEGPATASMLADRLGISATAVRRHLDALSSEGSVVASDRPPFGAAPSRGRGRPARTFALTDTGRAQFPSDYDGLAAEALEFVEQVGGIDAVNAFAESRAAGLETRLRERLGDDWRGASDVDQARAFAEALSDLGYATSAEPAPTGVQVCQHHCPVSHVAERYPQLCEAETEAFARILGHHVQRLATIAHGDGVCTTSLPLLPPRIDPTTTERTSA